MSELAQALEYARPAVIRILRQHQDSVDDVLGDTAVSALMHANSFQGAAQYKVWVYRIATNRALMFLRANKRTFVSADVLLDVPSKTTSPETQVIDGERTRILHEAIEELTPKRREAAYRALNGHISRTSASKASRFMMRQDLRVALTERGIR